MLSDAIIIAMEYIGTVAFAVSGTLVAIACSLDLFGVLTVGCITAVGGGIIRDMMCTDIPYVFKKHIYAVAAIVGSSVFYCLIRLGLDSTLATVIGMASTVILRLLAWRYRWNLPRVDSGAKSI